MSSLIESKKGSIMVITAASVFVIFGFVALATDLGYMFRVKSELQNIADAAVLAGASAFIIGDQNAREQTATQRATHCASDNKAGNEAAVIDVLFPTPDQIRVVAHRTQAKGNPLALFFARILGFPTTDITADATVQVFSLGGAKGCRPWCVPDRWDDANGNGEWDEGELYDPRETGYTVEKDVGVQVTLKLGNANIPSQYRPCCYPPVNKGDPITGAAEYERLIAEGYEGLVEVGDELLLEPGDMVGPTKFGVQELIDQDPTAFWNEDINAVDHYPSDPKTIGVSPRIVYISIYNPTDPPTSGRNSVFVNKLAAFFVDGVAPNGDLIGRFVISTNWAQPGSGSSDSFLIVTTLVE